MPRIRSIKPEFWSDRKMALELTRDERLFYVALWNEADDEGRLIADPRRLIGATFPYDPDVTEDVVRGWIDSLIRTGRMLLYEADAEFFAYLPKFTEHQKINRPSKSRIPDPPNDLRTLTADSLNTHGAFHTPPRAREEQGAGSREQGSGAGSMEQGGGAARARGVTIEPEPDPPAPAPTPTPPPSTSTVSDSGTGKSCRPTQRTPRPRSASGPTIQERHRAQLAEWVGEELCETFEALVPKAARSQWASTIWTGYGPTAHDHRVFRTLAPERRAAAVAKAMSEYVGDGGEWKPVHFAGFVRTAVSAELKPVTADGLTAEQEERKLQALRKQAAERATSRPVRARDGDPLMGHTEDELRAWYRGLDQEAQSEILRTKDRLLSVMAQGSVPLTPTARERCELQAIVGAYRQSAAAREGGPQSVGEILGKGAA